MVKRYLMLFLLSARCFALGIDPATLLPASAGYTEFRVKATNYPPPQPSIADVKMRFMCTPAKTGLFDPIVYPKQTNVGHWHQFFGNADVNPNSTGTTIKNSGNSTCDGGIAMRSSYWVPVLYDTATGKSIAPKNMLVYYTTGTGQKSAQQAVQAFPDGLVMIAGSAANASDTSAEFTRKKIFFQCYTPSAPNSAFGIGKAIPICNLGDVMQANISFPNCWDGKNLDSPDHKSHMAYSGNFPLPTYCPPSHPVRVIDIGLNIFYPVTTPTTLYWRFVSDIYNPALPGGYSLHADFMTGTSDYVKKMLIDNCFYPGMDCGMGLLGRDPVDGLFKRLY